jgi:hypothetical protein
MWQSLIYSDIEEVYADVSKFIQESECFAGECERLMADLDKYKTAVFANVVFFHAKFKASDGKQV